MTGRLRQLVILAGLLFVATHAPYLPTTLEDEDSVNFALGVESFNIFRHQPHPPGYPVYIAFGKVSTDLVGRWVPEWDRDRRAATGLAIVSLFAGAFGVWVIMRFWTSAGLSSWLAFLSALVAVASPLYWFTAQRPLSDMAGLVAAVAVQAGFLRGLSRREGRSAGVPAVWWWAAAGAGVVIGLRSQTMWLTGPLLVWAVVELSVGRRVREAVALTLAAAFGALLWVVPLVWLSGGLEAYLSVLAGQADQDFSGIRMLATEPSVALLGQSLSATFGSIWSGLEHTSILLVLAAVGGARLAWRDQRTLAIMLVAYVPYLVFHLAFHQVADLRYSLPLVVPVAGLVVSGLRVLGRTVATIASAALIVASLAAVQPAIATFANGHPVFKALRAMQDAYAPLDAKPAVTMHHQIWWGMGRAFDWYRPAWTVTEGPFPGARETLAATRHWLTGETRPMWFLAHPARTDLARFDPRTTTHAGDFLLASCVRRLVGDARSDEVVWWVIDRPDWMLGTGWSLTPELGGMTMADQAGPRVQPAQAFLRRTGDPIRLLVGGRHRGGAGSARARVTADVDGRFVHEWTVEPESWFVEWLELPEGTGAGGEPYAALRLGVTADEAGRPTPRLSFEQFDAVSEDEVAYALGHGWHELESDPESGRTWRWMSGLATIEVRHAGADVTLVLSGESRLGTFGWAPRVLVWAGRQELASFAPSGDFVRMIDVPVSALEAGSGVISISTDLTFAPTDLTDGPAARDSSLRLFGVEIVGRD